MLARRALLLGLTGLAFGTGDAPKAEAAGPHDSHVLVYSTEGNRLRRYDVDTVGAPSLTEDILIERAADDPIDGRDVNGMICPIPDGSGRFVLGEDTGQPTTPAGWGVFEADGTQVGKLTSTYSTAGAEPHGCAFRQDAVLFTTEVGDQGIGGTANGQLIMWFPPFDEFPGPPGTYPSASVSTNFCKLATDIGTATGIVIDAQGRVYVSSSSGLSVLRFSPPFPTSADAAGGCGATDALGSPLADSVSRETFIPPDGLSTFSGLALAPNGNLYAATNLTGEVREYNRFGVLVRMILDPPETGPPIATGNPQSLAVAGDGSIYYADLDLVGTLPNVGPGPNGKVRRIEFDGMNAPMPPEIVRQNLAFPDGVSLLTGNLEPLSEWRTYAGSHERRFYNPDEIVITNQNIDQLQIRWRFPTGAIITGSPTVAAVDVPFEGVIQVVYFQSWDQTIYAVRMRDGTELWSVPVEDQPGASFPNVASAEVKKINGQDVVFIGAGEIMYALDAVTGAELWRFMAGTGCRDALNNPPGLCGFSGERNEIESSVAVVGGLVFFSMDVNDVGTGKGGFYAVDALDGRLAWYFDLETGATCVPDPADDIRRFDGYHSEADLGLPVGFLATRAGCNFDRTVTGCGNVWSSPAVDDVRELLYFTSSNCDTDNDPGTPEPPPPMPAYDEAIVALGYDGVPVWRWRPREVDNDDLAFGAAPNLFTIDLGGAPREVLGVGNKDGTYYVLDRDGVNEVSGVAWNDVDPSALPYWARNVVAGGDIGGILLTAAVDEGNDRIYFSTAPGTNALNGPPSAPQQPTIHALDMNTGLIAWDNTAETDSNASFAPTSAIPGVAFFGEVPGATLRSYNTENDDGSKLGAFDLGNAASASAPAIVDGIVLVGAGIGTRTSTGSGPSDISAGIPSDLTALCVTGTVGCEMCGDSVVDWDEECDDGDTTDWDGCSATCETEIMWSFSGTAQGGDISFIVDGVRLNIVTSSGQTAGDIASAISAAILADGTLSARGVTTQVLADAVSTNGTITGAVITDPGIASSGLVPPVAFVPLFGWPGLLAAILGTGLLTLRRTARV